MELDAKGAESSSGLTCGAHRMLTGRRRKMGTQKEGFGCSKGCFTTKIHLIANTHGRLARAEITGGEISDIKGFDALVDSDLSEARVLIADPGGRIANK
ncbi:transposase [Hoeflea sp. AS60]|uniref:transposase n=1 Tax=Hoeflea sp. AS60 TaxID=3135780 RepID=UPI00316E5E2B